MATASPSIEWRYLTSLAWLPKNCPGYEETLLKLNPTITSTQLGNASSASQDLPSHHELTNELRQEIGGEILLTGREACRSCGINLTLDHRHHIMQIYTLKGPIAGKRYIKRCRSCSVSEYPGYYVYKGNRYFDTNWKNEKYLLTSLDTAFEIAMLRMFDIEFIHSSMSYLEKSAIYNEYHG